MLYRFLFLSALVISSQASAAADSNQAIVNLKGTVSPVCAMAFTQAAAQLDFSEAGAAKKLNFKLNCNTPLEYTLSAKYGRMRHESSYGQITGMNGFTTELPYSVALTAQNNPYNKQVSGLNLPQDSLTNDTSFTVKTKFAPYVTAGTLTVTKQALPAGVKALAGNYADTLTIEITARGA